MKEAVMKRVELISADFDESVQAFAGKSRVVADKSYKLWLHPALGALEVKRLAGGPQRTVFVPLTKVKYFEVSPEVNFGREVLS